MRFGLRLIIITAIFGYGSAALCAQSLSIGFLQSQYVTNSSVSSQSNQNSSLLPTFSADGSFRRGAIRTEADIGAVIPMQADGEFHVWFPDLNIQFGDRLNGYDDGRKTQVTVGRAVKDWSRLDSDWGLGLWQPQFRWDYIRPKQMGLTGLFFETQKHNLKFTAFMSGLYLPDQNAEFEEKDGQLVSGNRWFRPPVSQVLIYEGYKDIAYEVDEPSVSSVVFNPSYGMSLRAGGNTGAWAQFAMADKPANQFHIAIDLEGANKLHSELNTTDPKAEPIIHPLLVRHRLLTAEAGFAGDKTSFYASVTGENFSTPEDMQDSWEQAPLNDAIYYGVGGSHLTQIFGYKTVVFSGLVFKDNMKSDQEQGSMSKAMSSSVQRVAFERLVNIGIRYPMHPKVFSKWASELKYTYSMSDRAEWVMAQVSYQPAKDWSFYVGADILGSPDQVESDQLSFISKYRDNDRIEGGFTHVF